MNFLLQFLMFLLSLNTAPVIDVPLPDPVVNAKILTASTDAGLTWQDMSAGLPENLQPMCLLSEENEFYLGSTHGLFRGTAKGAIPMWNKDPQSDLSVGAIFPGKNGPYAISHWNGIYQFNKVTATWTPLHLALKDKGVFTLLETADGKLFAGCESGLYVTTDRGGSWQKSLAKEYVAQLYETEGVLLALSRYAMMRSTDRGLTWDRVLIDTGAPVTLNKTREGLVAIVNHPGIAGIRVPNSVFLSVDNGATWQQSGQQFPTSFGSLYALEEVGKYLVACNNEGIFRSADRGLTWEHVRKIPADKNTFFRLKVVGQTLFAILVEGC